jgi:hypothetical protein
MEGIVVQSRTAALAVNPEPCCNGNRGFCVYLVLTRDSTVGEMFLGLWRLVVSAGDFELPTRLMYRGNEWVRESAKYGATASTTNNARQRDRPHSGS